MASYGKKLLQDEGFEQQLVASLIKINAGRLSLILNLKSPPSERETKLLESFYKLPIHTILSTVDDEEIYNDNTDVR